MKDSSTIRVRRLLPVRALLNSFAAKERIAKSYLPSPVPTRPPASSPVLDSAEILYVAAEDLQFFVEFLRIISMDWPLLSSAVEKDVGRTVSVLLPAVSGADITDEEIRSASSFGQSYCPPPLHTALVSPPQGDVVHDHTHLQHEVHDGNNHQNGDIVVGRPTVDEVEARQLLIDHVGHHWCWGSHPARTWKVNAMEDCNVYVGTLETFIEEREAMRETEPYNGGKFDGRDRGPELGLWEIDLRSEFPLLYVPHEETKVKVPRSEAVEKCSGCKGRGRVSCGSCNGNQESGPNRMSQCSSCYGRGLIAHKDGSDTLCSKCSGKGLVACATCGSRGTIECHTCRGRGLLLTRTIAVVRWRTLSTRKVSATSGAASVPEEVFHVAQGVQLCNTQAYQCSPAFFPDSYSLNRFSSEVIAGRALVPPAARIISERHVISVIPVTRVTMAHRRQAFSFYVVGLRRKVFVRNYPSRFCWGLCCCLDWLKI